MTNIDNFFNKNFTYAIIGATDNQEKYGYKIFKTLLEQEYKVIPINPKLQQLENHKCYPNIESAKQKNNIDIVDFVTPPQITLNILKTLKNLQINKAWFQPGSYNEESIKFCQKHHIQHIKDFCLLKTALSKK